MNINMHKNRKGQQMNIQQGLIKQRLRIPLLSLIMVLCMGTLNAAQNKGFWASLGDTVESAANSRFAKAVGNAAAAVGNGVERAANAGIDAVAAGYKHITQAEADAIAKAHQEYSEVENEVTHDVIYETAYNYNTHKQEILRRFDGSPCVRTYYGREQVAGRTEAEKANKLATAAAKRDAAINAAKETSDRTKKFADASTKILLDATQAKLNEEINRKTEVAKVRETARIQAAGNQAELTQKLQFANDLLSDKKKLAAIVGVIGGSVLLASGSYYGTQLVAQWLKSKIGKPKLVLELVVPTTFKRLTGQLPKSRMNEIVLAPSIQERVSDIAIITKRALQQKGGKVSNVLFSGPPGTGKTMCAKAIGYASGLPVMIIQGSGFTQLDAGKDIQAMNDIFSYMDQMYKWYGPMIVFIDEADALIKKRYTGSERADNLTSGFLGLVEKPSSEKFMFIFATNNPGNMDAAIRSRIDEKVVFSLPTQVERVTMLKNYMKSILSLSKIKVAPEVESSIDSIAQRLEGYSGRDIEQLVINFERQVFIRNPKDKILTSELIEKAIVRSRE